MEPIDDLSPLLPGSRRYFERPADFGSPAYGCCLGAILGIVALIVGLPLLGVMAERRKEARRRHSPMRSLGTAIESYYVDHNCYPAEIPLRDVVSKPESLRARGGWNLSTLRLTPAMPIYLGRPLAYDSEILADPFTGRRAFPFHSSWRRTDGWPYAYSRGGDGLNWWFLWSPGPDLDYDILDPGALYDPYRPERTEAILELTYDPTNGVGSSGDVWRLKR